MTEGKPLASWLRLTLAQGIAPAALRRLLGEFGLPENVVAAGRTQLARFLPLPAIDSLHSSTVAQAVEHALAWAALPNHAVVALGDADYPKLLLDTADPPPLLYCVGQVSRFGAPALAVVGSRNATPQGEENAERFSADFSAAGLTIVSGLALGIDAAAHRGGLAGPGSTIAVLGTGIDRVYPPRHRPLAQRIASEGLLVSEFPLGTPARRENFPRRNRIISGLAQGCLVIEAALSSGSLITARAAAEQGREVFAVPGSIHSPLAKGCHALIKSGAKLVETAEDVLVELTAFRPQTQNGARERARNPAPGAQSPDAPLLAHLGFDPVDFETLRTRTGWPAQQLSAALLRLELAGALVVLPGARFQRRT